MIFKLFAFVSLLVISSLSTTIGYATIKPRGGYFEGQLKLLDVAEQHEGMGHFDPGYTEFQLLQDYSYRDNDGTLWTVPAGTVVDGASIPKRVWSVIGGPWSGRYRNAAVIHDWMCAEQLLNSDFVHKIFYEAMLANGVSAYTAYIMFEAVRRFGPQWEETPFGPTKVQRKEMTEKDLQKIT